LASPEQELFDRLKGAEGVKPSASLEASSVEKDLESDNPDVGKEVNLRNLFTHQDTHPVVIDFALLKAFGLEWYTWEPETIWAEIQRVFKMHISELNRAKVQTLKTLHVSNTAWDHWQVFEKIVQGLNNTVPRWAFMQVPSLEQLYAALDMLEHIRVVEFGHEVKLYIATAVLHEDVTFVHAPLSFVQLEVSQPYYHCKDCHSEYSALFHDGICDHCSQKFESEQGLSMKPKQELVSKGVGTNVETVLRHDPAEVQRRWDDVKSQPLAKVELEETAVDIQVAKLLVARDYMNIRRRQLAEQLVSLKSWLGAT
jgi:hypothetical protein